MFCLLYANCTFNSNSFASTESVATRCFDFYGNSNYSNASGSPADISDTPALLHNLPLISPSTPGFPQSDITSPSALVYREPLRLPTSPEEWKEAELSSVSLLVFQASSAEEKNFVLCSAVYDILAARYGTRSPPHQSRKHSQSKLRQHDRALKEVTRRKNEARRAFRKAKREGADEATVCSLAANFLSLLRQHSRLSRDSSHRFQLKETKRVREECHRNFWKFTKELLDGESSGQTSPEFSASTAYTFFSEVYQSSPHVFQTPAWMSTPSPPKQGCSMQMSPVTAEELARVIKKSRSSSSPSPFDRISSSRNALLSIPLFWTSTIG